MGFFWGDGEPLLLPNKSTSGLTYWGDGEPLEIIWEPELSLQVIGIASDEAIGGATVLPGPVTLSPTSIESQESVGVPLVVPTQVIRDFYYKHLVHGVKGYSCQTVIDGIPINGKNIRVAIGGTPEGGLIYDTYFVDEEWVGSPVVNSGATRIIVPESIPSPDDYGIGSGAGIPEVIAGAVTIAPESIGSQEVFGGPTIIIPLIAIPSGIESAEDFGTARIVLFILPTSIESEEVFGVGSIYPKNVLSPVAIVSVEAFGSPQINLQIKPVAIESEEAIGVPVFGGYVRTIGIESEETVGTPRVLCLVKPAGIVSEEAFGVPEAVPGPVSIYPQGVESGEVFGRSKVRPPRWPDNLIVLESTPLPTLEFADGLGEVDLYDSPIRMVVNG